MTKIQVDSNGKAIMLNNKALESSGGGSATIDTLNVTPSTTAQTITAPSGVDGYNPVNVSAVTSSIDNNITAGNIKKDVTILGVTGTYEGGGLSTKYNLSMDSILGNTVSGVLQKSNTDGNLIFSGVEDIDTRALEYAFYKNINIKSVSFPDLEDLTNTYALNYAFSNCTGLETASFSVKNITSSYVLNYAFEGCTNLTSANFSNLTTITGQRALAYAFKGCTNLTSVDFSNLTTIGTNTNVSQNNGHFYYTFNGCTKLTTLTFPKLEKIYCNGASSAMGTFCYNDKIQKLYFPKLDTITYGSGASTSNQNACKNIFYNCSALTEIHFAQANQSAIESSLGYSTAWGRGASNVTIYFDL